MKEKIALIDAREKPNTVKFTFLQLTVPCFSCFKTSSLFRFSPVKV